MVFKAKYIPCIVRRLRVCPTGQYMRTIYGGIVVQWLQTFFALVRLMLPNPPKKPFVCLWDIPTTENAMPEQFPLYLNTQPNIVTESYEYPITARSQERRNIHIRNARSTIVAPLHIVCWVFHLREHIIFVFALCIISEN